MKDKRFHVSYIFLVLLMALFLAPFYVMLVGAFKNQMALTLVPPDLNPFKNLILDNAEFVFSKTNIFGWLLNSLMIGIGVALGTVFIGATAGYAFAKKKFRGSVILFSIIIATMILPKQMLLIPNYLVAMNLHLTNSIIGVILTTIAPPFGIFLCKQFMESIPGELLEAADIDGCGEIMKFVRIVIPLAAPALGALAIFGFMGAWNDFLWQLIMITEPKLQTLPVGIAMFAQQSMRQYGRQLMGALFSTIPMLIIFLSCQKFFIKGITMGGVKG